MYYLRVAGSRRVVLRLKIKGPVLGFRVWGPESYFFVDCQLCYVFLYGLYLLIFSATIFGSYLKTKGHNLIEQNIH